MTSMRYIPFVGRLLIGIPFVLSGLAKLAAIGPTLGLIQAVGLPLPPVALAISVIVEVGGGLLLIAGFKARFVAAVLAVFSLATALTFHTNFADQNMLIHFLKNLMMAGGLLQIVAYGAGALSLDNRGTDGAGVF